jgi:hypothetical protein
VCLLLYSVAVDHRVIRDKIKKRLPEMYEFEDPGDLPEKAFELSKAAIPLLTGAERRDRSRPFNWPDERVAREWLALKVCCLCTHDRLCSRAACHRGSSRTAAPTSSA